jgi:hypothetical protein
VLVIIVVDDRQTDDRNFEYVGKETLPPMIGTKATGCCVARCIAAITARAAGNDVSVPKAG